MVQVCIGTSGIESHEPMIKTALRRLSPFLILLSLLCLTSCSIGTGEPTTTSGVIFPTVMVHGIAATVEIHGDTSGRQHITLISGDRKQRVITDTMQEVHTVSFIPEKGSRVEVVINGRRHLSSNRAIPFWYGIVPPLLAILFALVFKEVFTALILGLLSGTWMMAYFGGSGIFGALGKGLLRITDTYVIQTLTNSDHMAIIAFSLMIGGMVHIITRNGGMQGVIMLIMKVTGTRRSTMLSTWVMGLVLFFDDYANTLVVGNTMRPLSDRMNISREKLSYIVDSTAAPVAAVAFVTTWIGAELSYIKDALEVIGQGSAPAVESSPYGVFLNSLAYAFYPFLALAFVGMVIWMGRDFGAMYTAEKRVLQQGVTGVGNNTEGVSGGNAPEVGGAGSSFGVREIRPRVWNALLPVMALVGGAFAGLIFTGLESTTWDSGRGFASNLSEVIGQADTFRALLWASFGSLMLAVLLTVSQRVLTLRQTTDSMTDGFKTMLNAIIILVLAWSLALVTKQLHTAEFLSHLILQSELTPRLIPVITFLLAAGVAFSTGSSWSTMAILFPLLLPTSWNLFHEYQMDQATAMMLFHATVASVLAGSVMGDHCSPISDTTILSSLATQCNHIDHVKTQMPYALTTGAIAAGAGVVPVSFGLHPAAAFLIALALAWGTIRWFGKK